MITECAPIDALCQRFGRVDRRGRRAAAGKPAEIRILGVASVIEAAKPPFDPVYGDSLREAWHWLHEQAPKGRLDVGIAATLLGDAPAETLAPSQTAPLLLPSHLDALVQTRPTPVHQPSPATWLHGTDETDTDVRVVWRADLRIESRGASDASAATGPGAYLAPDWLASMLAARPPREAEALPVPIAAAKRWLNRDGVSEVVDINARITDDRPHSSASTRMAVRWSASETEVIPASGIQPGDLLVVPSTYGGVAQRTWSPDSELPVADLADLVLSDEPDAPASVRLLPEFFPQGVPLPNALDADEGADRHDVIGAWTEERVGATSPQDSDENELHLRTVLAGEYDVSIYPVGNGFRYLLRESGMANITDLVALDGSDTVNSMLGKPVTLQTHLAGVGEMAREFAHRCGCERRSRRLRTRRSTARHRQTGPAFPDPTARRRCARCGPLS